MLVHIIESPASETQTDMSRMFPQYEHANAISHISKLLHLGREFRVKTADRQYKICFNGVEEFYNTPSEAKSRLSAMQLLKLNQDFLA